METNTTTDTNSTEIANMAHSLHDSIEEIILHKLPIPQEISGLLDISLFGNSLAKWGSALIVLLIFLALRKQFSKILTLLAFKWVNKTASTLDDEILDLLQRPIAFAMVILGFNLALSFLKFNADFTATMSHTMETLMIVLSALVVYRIIKLFEQSDELMARRFKSDNGITLAKLLLSILKAVVLIIAGMSILSTWGVNITGFIASLGLIGMAFALAAKDTASNFFGSMVIFTDQPFKVGDWIKTPEVEGTIEHIGIRSTRVRTFAQALVSVPNGNLADTAILNWSEMKKRQIKMTLGVTYSTTAEQMRTILKEIRELLHSDEEIDQQTIYVHFTEFQESALGIFCYFFTKTTQWGEYMQIRERINLELMAIVEKNGTSFAFPSHSLYLESMPKSITGE